MAGWQDINVSMGQTLTSDIAHNISSAEEKVDTLKSGRSMDEDLSLLSIRFVSFVVGRTLVHIKTQLSPDSFANSLDLFSCPFISNRFSHHEKIKTKHFTYSVAPGNESS
jgi:hypothetical protein